MLVVALLVSYSSCFDSVRAVEKESSNRITQCLVQIFIPMKASLCPREHVKSFVWPLDIKRDE